MNKLSEQQARTSFTGIRRDVAVYETAGRSHDSHQAPSDSVDESFEECFLMNRSWWFGRLNRTSLMNELTLTPTVVLFSNPPAQYQILQNFRIGRGESFPSACESRHHSPSYVGAAATASVLSIDWTFAYCVFLWQLQRSPWWKMSSLKRWRNDYGSRKWRWTPECLQIDAQVVAAVDADVHIDRYQYLKRTVCRDTAQYAEPQQRGFRSPTSSPSLHTPPLNLVWTPTEWARKITIYK